MLLSVSNTNSVGMNWQKYQTLTFDPQNVYKINIDWHLDYIINKKHSECKPQPRQLMLWAVFTVDAVVLYFTYINFIFT